MVDDGYWKHRIDVICVSLKLVQLMKYDMER